MASTKRIAVCLSGQPRTWEKCYQTWINTLGHLGQVDFFCHLWDFNSLSSWAAYSQNSDGTVQQDTPISDYEKQKIITTLSPKKIVFGTKQQSIDALVIPSDFEHPIAHWAHSQFYSLSKAAWYKRQYEIENKFEYDLVFRIRTDCFLQDSFHPPEIKPNTLYSIHNVMDWEVNQYRIADIFYFCDSFTFDQLAGFYESFNYIDPTWVSPNAPGFPPEVALYYFAASKGINNIHVVDFENLKIMRSQEHVEAAGVLQSYETT